MNKSFKAVLIKIILSLLIFALILSIKTVILINLENLGLSYNQASDFRISWNNYYGDIIFLIITIIISVILAIKINIKGE